MTTRASRYLDADPLSFVSSKKFLMEKALEYADARTALQIRLEVAKESEWRSLAEIRRTYPATDMAGPPAIFNIRGNHYRLIVRMVFARRALEKMAAIDNAAYGGLLARTLARVIESDSENERLIAETERIDSLPNASAEEKELAELIGLPVESYERRYDLGHADPVDALRQLMEDRGMRQRDLIPVFGSSSVASDVLNRKREISKRHARGLAEMFSVPVGIFI